MKTCPKCGTEHDKTGTFCSRTCANSRQWTPAQKQVFSERQKAYMAREESEEHREGRKMRLQMLHAAGIAGKAYKSVTEEELEYIATRVDDFLVVPFNDDDLKVMDGDIWEDIDDIKY